jgi:hypothetical protein
MTKENYFLALYQALINRNLTKILELGEISEEDEENYSEEYPELDYNAIFGDNDPDDFLTSLLISEEFKGLAAELERSENHLATDENIAIREESHLKLMSHPLVNYCLNPIYSPSVVGSLISFSYSTVITKEEMADKLGGLINQSPIIKDVLSIAAISNTVVSSKPIVAP